MASRYKFSENEIKAIEQRRKENKDKRAEARMKALELRAKGASAKEVAEATGFHAAYVTQLVAKYRGYGLEAISGNHYGGNHRNMSMEEETCILAPFKERAEKGELVEISEIAKAYQSAVYHPVSRGQIYFVLHRHGCQTAWFYDKKVVGKIAENPREKAKNRRSWCMAVRKIHSLPPIIRLSILRHIKYILAGMFSCIGNNEIEKSVENGIVGKKLEKKRSERGAFFHAWKEDQKMAIETSFDYYYGDESSQFSFYRIPRQLITGDRFKRLSTDAKLLYGLLLDRMGLSAKNGWYDEAGRVYIYYTLDEIQEDLNCGHEKAVKLLSELDTGKGFGLIERVKQGQGRPTKIYVKRFTTREKPQQPAVPQDVPRLPIFGSQDFGKSEVKISEKQKSRLPISGSADFRKSDASYIKSLSANS